MMKKVKVTVGWTEKNFSAATSDEILGGVCIVTSKTYEQLLDELRESIMLSVEDENEAPAWLREGRFDFDVEFTMAAILQRAQRYTTLAAISRATGIKHAQLSHYANALSVPRSEQRKKIIDGLHEIGRACLSVA